LELKDLIKSCIKNNREAQGELFRRYKDALYLVSLKYSRNEVEAEDNLHDSFITIFEIIKTYKNKGSFEGWLKRITINKAINKYKKIKPTNIIINNDILLDTTIEPEKVDISLNAILSCIQKLPNQYRLVFNLYQLDGYTHKEIAALLSISIGTSKSNLHRAKILLKKHISSKTQPLSVKYKANGA